MDKVKTLRFELLMDAGFGAQKAGDIFIKALARTGRKVFIEPMIPAEISPPARTRPALSGTIVRMSDSDLTNIGNTTDIILAQHEIVLERRLDDEEHSKDTIILLDMGDKKRNEETYERVCKRVSKEGLKLFPISITEEAQNVLKSLAGKGKNIYYVGMLSVIYNMPEDIMIEEIKRIFGKKLKEEILEKNIELFHLGYMYAKKEYRFKI